MSLKLLIDEDMQAKKLVGLLRLVGHDVLTARDAGLAAMDDLTILTYARETGRALLTRNAGDFRILHDSLPDHTGILAMFQDSDPANSMSYAAIVKAIANIEASGLNPAGHYLALNAWNW